MNIPTKGTDFGTSLGQAMAAAAAGAAISIATGRVRVRTLGKGQEHPGFPFGVVSLEPHYSGKHLVSPGLFAMSLEQAIPLLEDPAFQSLSQSMGRMHELWRPVAIPLCEIQESEIPQDRSLADFMTDELRQIAENVKQRLVNRDVVIISVERCRFYMRGPSAKSIAEPIALEAFDPATGALVWSNPLINLEMATQATQTAPTAAEFSASGRRMERAAMAPVPPPAKPEWYVSLANEAQEFGIPNIRAYIVKKHAQALVADGCPSMEAAMAESEAHVARAESGKPIAKAIPAWFTELKAEAAEFSIPPEKVRDYIVRKHARNLAADMNITEPEALAQATKLVAAVLGEKPPVVPADAAPAPRPAPRPAMAQASTPVPVAPLTGTGAVASALGISFQGQEGQAEASRRQLRRTAQARGPLPAILTIENLQSPFQREELQQRVIAFIRENGVANSIQVKNALVDPEEDPTAAAKALQRHVFNVLMEKGILDAAGSTRARTYSLKA